MSEVKVNDELIKKLGFVTKVNPKLDITKPTSRVIAAIYIRVSDPRQADPVKGSLDEQIVKCKKAIESNGWEFNGKIYKDEFKGHRIETRQGLNEMLEDAAKGFFNVLVVLDSDRFSRNRRTAAVTRSRLVDDHFIQIYEVNQPREIIDPALYDPNEDDSGVIHEAIVDIKSDLEVKRLRKKVRQGARTRALRGEPHSVPYGFEKKYKQIHPTVLFEKKINDKEAEIVQRIFRLFVREDYSYRKICSMLNKEKIPAPMGGFWRPPTIRKMLGNPFYIGFVRHNHRPVFRGKRKQTPPEEWILIQDSSIPKIIDDDTFKAAQERMKQRYVFRGRAIASEGLLIPLAHCHCGHRLHYKRQNPTPSTLKRSPNATPRLFYGCPCNQLGGVRVCPCNTYKMSASKLELMVVQRLHELAQTAEAKEVFARLSIDKFVESLKHQITTTKYEIFKLNTAKDRWEQALDEGYAQPKTYFEHTNEIELKLKSAQTELSRLEYSLESIEQNSGLWEKKREFLLKFDDYFNNGDLAKKKKVLQQFIKRVVVGDNGDVHIDFIVDDIVEGVMLDNNVHPHPCGYLGHPRRACTCTQKMIAKYRHRLSGPILDRIDLTVLVSPVEVEKLSLTRKTPDSGLTSREAKNMVVRARSIQEKRFAGTGLYTNSQMKNREVKQYCKLTPEAENLLKLAAEKYDFSARSYMRLIKVARTIADLASEDAILPVHMAEALQYKQLQ